MAALLRSFLDGAHNIIVIDCAHGEEAVDGCMIVPGSRVVESWTQSQLS